ncbi:Pyruvate formate-lyase-activating enzyme [compost metagenome]
MLVPGINDDESDLRNLGRFVGGLNGVEKLELLPYHQMGIYKWQELGWAYPLEGVPSPTSDEVNWATKVIEEGRQETAVVV